MATWVRDLLAAVPAIAVSGCALNAPTEPYAGPAAPGLRRCSAATVAAPPGGGSLTLKDAIHLASANHPEAVACVHDVTVARAQLRLVEGGDF